MSGRPNSGAIANHRRRQQAEGPRLNTAIAVGQQGRHLAKKSGARPWSEGPYKVWPAGHARQTPRFILQYRCTFSHLELLHSLRTSLLLLHLLSLVVLQQQPQPPPSPPLSTTTTTSSATSFTSTTSSSSNSNSGSSPSCRRKTTPSSTKDSGSFRRSPCSTSLRTTRATSGWRQTDGQKHCR